MIPHHVKVHEVNVSSSTPGRVAFWRRDNQKLLCTFFLSTPSSPAYTIIDGNATGDEVASVICALAEPMFDRKRGLKPGLSYSSNNLVDYVP